MIIDRVTLWRRFHLLLLYNHLDLFCATSRFRLYLFVSTTIFFKLIHQLNTCLRYLNHSICTLLFPSSFFGGAVCQEQWDCRPWLLMKAYNYVFLTREGDIRRAKNLTRFCSFFLQISLTLCSYLL